MPYPTPSTVCRWWIFVRCLTPPRLSKALLLMALAGGLVSTACKREAPAATSLSPKDTSFIVSFEGLELRAGPGPEAEALARLPAGARLIDLGKVSDFTTPVRLGGIPFDEPWILVQTESGEKGWVYAGGLRFEWKNGQPARLLEKRLQTWLGPDAAARLAAYRQAFAQVSDADSFARVYRQGISLRNEWVEQLYDRFHRAPGQPLPDLFWLRDAFPGFIPQLVKEESAYYLFADYRQWRQCAGRTPEADDDAFIELCLAAFPEDSIEYFFPAWTIQISESEGHSLLGRGIHQRLLRQMDRALNGGGRFRPEIEALKKQVLADITNPQGRYWEPLDRIIREVEAILAQPPDCLLRYDRIALQGRLDQFRNPDAAGIVANQRAGE